MGEVARAGQLLAVKDKAVVAGEVELVAFEQVQHVLVLLVEALAKTSEDRPCRRGVAVVHCQVVELVAEFFKLREIGLEEVEVKIVQRVEIAVEELGGGFIIDRQPQVMLAAENLRDEFDDVGIVLALHQRSGIGGPGVEKIGRAVEGRERLGIVFGSGRNAQCQRGQAAQ